MSICLGFETALEFLRLPSMRTLRFPGAPLCPPALSRQRGSLPRLRSPSAREARAITSRYGPEVRCPLHVLVDNPDARRASQLVRPHLLTSPLPRRLCVQVEDELYVAGPELCFVHMARMLDLPELIELGLEMCGTYAINPRQDGCVTYDIEPLTTTHRLARRISSMSAGSRLMCGTRKAAAALQYLLDGSGSPRETHQAMSLCLPQALGGYALGRPLLNHRLEVRGAARELTDRSYYVCDAYWPEARLDVEYDSDAFHAGAERMAQDAMRRNALLAMGVTVITVTNAQMRDAAEFDRVARIIAGKLGVKPPKDTPAFRRNRAALRERLSGGLY